MASMGMPMKQSSRVVRLWLWMSRVCPSLKFTIPIIIDSAREYFTVEVMNVQCCGLYILLQGPTSFLFSFLLIALPSRVPIMPQFPEHSAPDVGTPLPAAPTSESLGDTATYDYIIIGGAPSTLSLCSALSLKCPS